MVYARLLIVVMAVTSSVSMINNLYFVVADQPGCYEYFDCGLAGSIALFTLIRFVSHYPVICLCLSVFWLKKDAGSSDEISVTSRNSVSDLSQSFYQELNSSRYSYFQSSRETN